MARYVYDFVVDVCDFVVSEYLVSTVPFDL